MEENEKLLIETVQRAKSNQRRIDELEKRVDEHHALGAPIKLNALVERVDGLEKNVSEIHRLDAGRATETAERYRRVKKRTGGTMEQRKADSSNCDCFNGFGRTCSGNYYFIDIIYQIEEKSI